MDGYVAIRQDSNPDRLLDNEVLVIGANTVYRQRVQAPESDVILTNILAAIGGGLTDTELRATPVPVSVPGTIPVSGPLTDLQLRAVPVPVSGTVSTGGLTDAQLRATAVPVSGTVAVTGTQTDALTDAELRAAAVPVSGTVAVSNFPASQAVTGPFLTDGQLRATPVPVSGPLTDTELRATAVPVSGTVSVTGVATFAEQQTQTASLSVMDDWDESDRAKVNIIAGQVGVQGAAGASTALTQRVALATDANAVDTELPTAAALSDTTANPIAPMVGGALMGWDSTAGTWRRVPIEDAAAGVSSAPHYMLPTASWGHDRIANLTRVINVDNTGATYVQQRSGTIEGATVKVKSIDMTTATTTDIVALVAAKKIRVLGYQIFCNESVATNINFVTGAGTTRVTGSPLIKLNTNGQNAIVTCTTGAFLFETVSGEALRVTQDGATDISIAVQYIEV